MVLEAPGQPLATADEALAGRDAGRVTGAAVHVP